MFNTREKRERSLGVKLFLKPHRCGSPKCVAVRRPTRPGVHGALTRVRRLSEYGTQLREKQKMQATYGLREAAFRRLMSRAFRSPEVTSEKMLRFLERRLDNVIYQLGFAPSRSVARQLVGHGHMAVNGRRVTIPSYEVKIGDTISVRPASRERAFLKDLSEPLKKHEPPPWLSREAEGALAGKVIAEPRDVDAPFDLDLVVDYYSKKLK